ncbi:MAG: A/G-specific adenine glycosylase [Bacteroidota bacterium]
MSENGSFVSYNIINWYSTNKRDLPWRNTNDPYLIWISEIILQQTRVAQGLDYYLRFQKTFPDITSLANAHEDDILKLWQGLGYYSRARNLHNAAKEMATTFEGVFPSEYKAILSLKGVGEYTAAAIASFAFGLPHAVVDGNVFRFLSRLFAIDTPIDTSKGKKLFTELSEKLLNKQEPALHNQAIMEFGALQCVPVSPKCGFCPFNEKCLAYIDGQVSKYPVKQGKTKTKDRFFNYFEIRNQSLVYINKRTGNDIWKNLYELPLIETETRLSFEELQKTDAFGNLFKGAKVLHIYNVNFSLKHVLSHQIIYANFHKVEIIGDDSFTEKFTEIDIANLPDYAISRLVDRYFESTTQPDLFL